MSMFTKLLGGSQGSEKGIINSLFSTLKLMGIDLNEIKLQLFDFIHEKFYVEQQRIQAIIKDDITLVPVIKSDDDTIYFNYLLVKGDKIIGTHYQDDKNMRDIVNDFDVKKFLDNLKKEAEDVQPIPTENTEQPGETTETEQE